MGPSRPVSPADSGRCEWARGDDAMATYHDQEWGVPQRSRAALFEFLLLEGAQAGLSWRTILLRREGYRNAFAGFDPEAISSFGPEDVQRCLADVSIIRNRAKVAAFIKNASAWLQLDDPVEFLWQFVDGRPVTNHWTQMDDVPAITPQSETMSRELRRHGFTFVGPTICYALMQATGMVNDHLVTCVRHREVRQP